MLRFNDVHCTLAILSIREETPTHRLGIYFLEIQPFNSPLSGGSP